MSVSYKICVPAELVGSKHLPQAPDLRYSQFCLLVVSEFNLNLVGDSIRAAFGGLAFVRVQDSLQVCYWQIHKSSVKFIYSCENNVRNCKFYGFSSKPFPSVTIPGGRSSRSKNNRLANHFFNCCDIILICLFVRLAQHTDSHKSSGLIRPRVFR